MRFTVSVIVISVLFLASLISLCACRVVDSRVWVGVGGEKWMTGGGRGGWKEEDAHGMEEGVRGHLPSHSPSILW